MKILRAQDEQMLFFGKALEPVLRYYAEQGADPALLRKYGMAWSLIRFHETFVALGSSRNEPDSQPYFKTIEVGEHNGGYALQGPAKPLDAGLLEDIRAHGARLFAAAGFAPEEVSAMTGEIISMYKPGNNAVQITQRLSERLTAQLQQESPNWEIIDTACSAVGALSEGYVGLTGNYSEIQAEIHAIKPPGKHRRHQEFQEDDPAFLAAVGRLEISKKMHDLNHAAVTGFLQEMSLPAHVINAAMKELGRAIERNNTAVSR